MAGQGGLAEDLRTGLNQPDLTVVRSGSVDPLDELSFGKPVRQHIREFGALMGIILLAVAALCVWRERSVALVGALTATGLSVYWVGARRPQALAVVWRSWMTMAGALGHVMTTVILTIGWVCLVLPTSVALRILRIKVMDTTFRSPVASYWEARDSKLDDFKLLERQF